MPIRRTSLKPEVEHGNFTGINNIDKPILIGPRALVSCKDYDNRQDGVLVVRPGQTSITNQAAHSIWSNKSKTLCLYRTGSNIVRLNDDESSTVLASGFVGNKMIFRDGFGDQVFLTDGTAIGELTNSGNTYQDLSAIPPMDHFKNSPAAGISIEFWHGRLYVIVGDKAFFSDPYMPTQFDTQHNVIPFSGPITLFRGMNGGIFVADGKIRFLSGGDPTTGMPPTTRADYDAIPGTDVIVPGDSVGKQARGGMVLFFLTDRGVCTGGDDGGFKNETEKKFKGVFTDGAALFRHDLDNNRYIVVGKG
jgi:hypothetical protein